VHGRTRMRGGEGVNVRRTDGCSPARAAG
jgi:hypothetical protein